MSSFDFTTRPTLVHFTSEYVQPPAVRYLSRDDRFYILSYSLSPNTELALRFRIMQPDGRIERLDYRHVTSPISGSSTLEDFAGMEGFILSAGVFTAAGDRGPGNTYVQIGVLRGTVESGNFVDSLAAGYVIGLGGVSYPAHGIRTRDQVEGEMFREFGTNPAAGNEITEQVPAGRIRRLVYFAAALTTSSTAVTRTPTLEVLDDALTHVARFWSPRGHTAGQTWRYQWMLNISVYGGAQGTSIIPISWDLDIRENWFIRTNTANLQAGDNWGAPTFIFRDRIAGE